MLSFNEAIKEIQSKTKWKNPYTNSDGLTCFTLLGKNEEELELEFFAPNDSFLIMQVKLENLPTDNYEKKNLIKDYAKKQVAACKKRKSILTLDKNNVTLYKKTSLDHLNNIIDDLDSFLKDVDWWLQKELTNSFNPFSFSMSWNK